MCLVLNVNDIAVRDDSIVACAGAVEDELHVLVAVAEGCRNVAVGTNAAQSGPHRETIDWELVASEGDSDTNVTVCHNVYIMFATWTPGASVSF